MATRLLGLSSLGLALWLLGAGAASAQPAYFAIEVVDEAGAPVPCVELLTVHELRFVTDASGRVAFYEPGLMDTDVWFHVSGPHVALEPDWLGFAGARLSVRDGGAAQITVTRTGEPPCEAGDLASRQLARGVPAPSGYFRVDVLDAETERGVPLAAVEVAGRSYVTDSAGVIAIDPLAFDAGPHAGAVRAHGYEPIEGASLEVSAGAQVTLRATRSMLAERLYRVTGAGIYRDSVLLGLPTPTARPTINALVLGQDTAFTVVHRDRLFWIWGDTLRAAYPLGHFRTSGATSELPGHGGLDPERGVDLTYFVNDEGFSRPMAPAETVPGDGLAWLAGLVSVPDGSGEARLFATFGMFAGLAERTRFGMLEYDEERAHFFEAAVFDEPDERYPRENAFLVEHDGVTYAYYHQSVRVPATAEAMRDPATYEAFTPYLDPGASSVERDAQGRAVYRWRAGGVPHPSSEANLGADDLRGHLVDVDDGASFEAHENGSTEYDEHLGRYVRLILPRWDLGAVWVAVADTPMGPWVNARRVVHHDEYSFYNPRHHHAFDRDFGRRIYFEATYTTSFSSAPARTPRYDYNQVMYGLDLDREELALPVPIYESARGELGPHEVVRSGDAPLAPRFLAPVRPRPGTQPVWWSGPACEPRRLIVGGAPQTPPLFYAIEGADPRRHQETLYAVWGAPDQSPRYTTAPDGDAEPIAVVWRNPIRVALPVAEHRRGLDVDAGPDLCLEAGEGVELPEGAWRVDGEARGGGPLDLAPGLHVLTRVETRADGFAVQDHAIVRVGAAPPLPPPPASRCGCRALGAPAPAWSWVAWLTLALALRRRSGARSRR